MIILVFTVKDHVYMTMGMILVQEWHKDLLEHVCMYVFLSAPTKTSSSYKYSPKTQT